MIYVQFGGFTDCPDGWVNYETSMHLRLSRLPILGRIFKKITPYKFSDEIIIGDIVKGLPIEEASVDVVFSSHVIEHLSRDDAQAAFNNVFKILKPGGVFRLVVPDLFARCKYYIDHYNEIDDPSAWLMKSTLLGKNQPHALKLLERVRSTFSTSSHKWMWDEKSLSLALVMSGFQDIRRTTYAANDDNMIFRVEKKERFFWSPEDDSISSSDIVFPELAIEAKRGKKTESN